MIADRSARLLRIAAVVPARGGSKGIPKKNITDLDGQPLIAYTLEAARQSAYLDRVVVSTDDDDIKAVAERFGAEVIRRPAELSSDSAPTELALLHALDHLEQHEGFHADVVVTLEPTSPLRTSRLIDQCIEALVGKDADSVLTVTENLSCLGRIDEGYFEFLFKNQPRRRQERQPLYQESSTVYVTRVETLRKGRLVLGDRVRAVVASSEEAVDINTPFDLIVAESILRAHRAAKS